MKIKKITALTIAFIFMFNVLSMASTATQNIAVEFNTVNITVNGNPAYAGNILYNGTTYVPIRATANMLDCKVEWDEKTNTAIITESDNSKNNKEYFEIYEYLEKLNEFYLTMNLYSFYVMTAENNIYDWDFLDSEYSDGYTMYENLINIYNSSSDLYDDILKNQSMIDIKFSTKVDAEVLYDLFDCIHNAFTQMELINQTLEVYDKENYKLMTEDEIVDRAKYLNTNILLSAASRSMVYKELVKLKNQ